MSHYRLLRDNKETGPFSEEEMIAKGFKPYDLIWVEGRSAGWRYPSEIPAFKNFAPVVEEQPYDRFYRKDPPQKLFTADEKISYSSFTPPAKKIAAVPAQPQPAFAATADFNLSSLPARHIHVTLPSGNTINLNTLVKNAGNKAQKDPASAAEPEAVTELQAERVEAVRARALAASAKPAALNTVSSDTYKSGISFEKEKATVNTPALAFSDRQQPVAGLPWSLIAAAFIGVATLVGLGIMIGLAMNREKNDLAFNEALLNKSKQSVVNRAKGNSSAPVTSGVTEAPANVEDQELLNSGKELVQNAVVKTNGVIDTEIRDSKKLQQEEKPVQDKTKMQEMAEAPVLHAKPAVPVAINLEKNLSVTANDFKTGAFGGISGLKCTLYNGSRYPLESVEVEVSYVQANDKVYKSEKLFFKDIPAGAQATIEAPSSNRGVKITSRIIKVNAKESALSNTTAKS